MAVSAEFLDMVLDMLSDMGPVSRKRMFGGAGIFLDGTMFALITNDTMYLKADDENRADFEDLSLGPFTYERQGKQVALSYFETPDECFDDPDVMTEWCRNAWQAARRAQ